MGAQEARNQGERPIALAPVVVALVGAALLITAGGAAFGATGWWAFGFLTYVPLGLRWAAGAIIVLASVPFAYGWWRLLGKIAIPWWAALPVALAAFWIFREQTWHGDALYKVDLLATQPLQANPYVWKEPLDSLLEYAVSGLVQPVGLGPDVAIALMSVVAGGVFVLATWAAAAWLAGSALRRHVIYTALLAGGTSLLWFGHIENYSWSTAMAFATLALAAGHLAGRAPLWAAAVAGGAAISFHPQAVFILPALLALLRRDRWPRQVVTLVLGGLVVPLLTTGVFLWLKVPPPGLNGGFAGDPQLFWTPLQALAPAQLAEALQNLWIIAPLWPLWIGAGVWGVVQPALRRDRTFLLLAVAAAGVLFYFFAFQNDLARQRDWDLFAIAGPPLALWGAYAWLRLLEMAPSLRVAATLRQTLATALVFAAAFTLFWVGVNHAYTIVRPTSAERDLYVRYRLLDLIGVLAHAAVTPDAPICAEPSGCERVALTEFSMPQTGDRRPVIFAHAPAEIALPLTVPAERAFLWLSPALDPQAWDWGGDGVTFTVKVRSNGGEATLWSRHITPADPADRDWQQVFVPLDDYRGQAITLVLATDPGPAGNDSGDRAGWGMPWLMRGTVAP